MQTALPDQIGPYQVLRRLGGGGFTEVLLARDTRHRNYGTLVAVKRLRPGLIHRDPVFLDSLLSEAEIGMSIRDRHLVQVEGVLDDSGEPAMVMEYVDGFRLDRLLGISVGEGVLPEAAAEIARQLCEALFALHTSQDGSGQPQCLVHQDVKPSNIMITRGGLLKLLDFNLARPAGGNLISLWVRQGTPGYRSPEQTRGDWRLTPASDLYSVGVVLYELLSGRRLFEDMGSDADRHLERQRQVALYMSVEAPRISPPGLDLILQKLLAAEPRDRYGSADEVAAQLAHWQHTWNKHFDLSRYLQSLRARMEAYAELESEPEDIHCCDTQLGERLVLPMRERMPLVPGPIPQHPRPVASAAPLESARAPVAPRARGERVPFPTRALQFLRRLTAPFLGRQA